MFGSTGLLVFADDFLGTIERLHVLPLLKKQPTGVKKGDVSLFTQRLCQEQTNRGNTHKNITPERHWWSETPQGTFKITSFSVVNMLVTQYAEYVIVSAVFVCPSTCADT